MSDASRAPGSDAPASRTRLWRRRDGSTLEHCRLLPTGDDGKGPQLEGAVVGVLDGRPLRAEYTVACTRDWRTRYAEVVVAHGDDVRRLELTTDGAERWWRGGAEVAGLSGCLDVDISITPSTNILPIRRLALAVGDAHFVSAAWVRVPSLDIEVLPQHYTRLDARRWRYASARGAFIAELEVDEAGLVMRYGEIWETVEV